MVRSEDSFLPKRVVRWVAPELPTLAPDALQRLKGVDTVVHLAGRAHILQDGAKDPLTAFRLVNTEGTLALASTAVSAGVQRFIFVSSIGVNGSRSGDHPFRPEHTPHPDSPYAQSKWEAEQALNRLQAESGLTVLHLRPPMIYGQAAPGNFALLARLVAKGWPLPLGGLRAPRSFVALENVVNIVSHMVLHPNPPSGVYLVSDGQVTTTTEFIRAIALGMGKNLRLIPVPPGLLLFLANLVGRREYIRKLCVPLEVDIRSTETRLGWTPPVSMDCAMQHIFSDSTRNPSLFDSLP